MTHIKFFKKNLSPTANMTASFRIFFKADRWNGRRFKKRPSRQRSIWSSTIRFGQAQPYLRIWPLWCHKLVELHYIIAPHILLKSSLFHAHPIMRLYIIHIEHSTLHVCGEFGGIEKMSTPRNLWHKVVKVKWLPIWCRGSLIQHH